MTTPSASGYISNNARTETEVKQWLEDVLAITKEFPGGAAESTLTIASGVITPTAAIHKVDTEGAAAADDLTTIATTHHPDGRLLLLRAADTGRVVTVKNNTGGVGKIALLSGTDLNLNLAKWAVLKRTGTDWEQVLFGPGELLTKAEAAFRGALVYKTSSQTVASGSFVVVTFDAESYDTSGIHDTSSDTDRLTVPSGVSRVRLSCGVTWSAGTTGFLAAIRKNGLLNFVGSVYGPDSSSLTNVCITPVIDVAAGDNFSVYVSHSTGGDKQVYGASPPGQATWFAMEIVE